MSKADWIYLKTTNTILKNGDWDLGQNVRTKWSDGTSAYTIKTFAVNNVYDLENEFPIITLRYINWKSAIDEILWIWQLKSNNVKQLNSHIWDQWTDNNGSIGNAYGWQVKQKSLYEEGIFDQIDRVIYCLKNKPAFRSIITELFVHKDLHKIGLYPCVHGMQFDVSNGKLNLFLNQRSNDTLTAGSWNVVQYSALVYMLAQVCNLKPGRLSHMVVNSHIYDRHIPYIFHITFARIKFIQDSIKNIVLSKTKIKLSKEEFKKFNQFYEKITKSTVNFDKLIDEAIKMEQKIGEIEKDKNSLIKDYKDIQPQNIKNYCTKIVNTKEFKFADYIIDTLHAYPNFEKLLGFKTPYLILNKNIDNFYNYISPKCKDKKGQIIDNEQSSFSIKNYDYETFGVELQSKVPVAE